ncbi:magnesium and cobalt transport protein CorA [Carboxydothermus islandicus]|uniref:Magnesium transport protein CorA n=1 Tax=Carboxydothermus islandicus TaxID=661089 RepID=A0A1L8CYZ0_9THEO|nr:magnesium/cobalt transporter CorA [Carboxydothermus islandicus]GAV24145.1 magnesium and cobalt transport protein CorA [Carboxydothermus islandicus]
MIKTYYYNHKTNTMEHDVDLSRLSELLADPESLLWVDLYNFEEKELYYLARIFNFHELTVEDCLTFSPRAKVDKYENYYFFLLHALRYDEEQEEEILLVQLGVYLGSNFIVTVHKSALPSLGKLALVCRRSSEICVKGTEYFLYSIIDGIVDEYFPILEQVANRIEDLEDEIYEQPNREITDEFIDLKRTILAIRRAISHQKRIFGNLIRPPFPLSEEIKPYFSDLADHLERATDTVDSQRDMLDQILMTYNSIITTRTNETMRVLTIISTIFMPLTFVTGFFGMNVPFPAQDHYISTGFITAGLIAISYGMIRWFKYKNWM